MKTISIEDLENEIWAPIEDYPRYLVSNHGRVKSLGRTSVDKWGRVWIRKDKVLSLSVGARRVGYPFVSIHNSAGKKMQNIHRLVAMAFIPNPDNKPIINHINNLRHDNRVENLEWCTASENMQHAINQDRHPLVTKKSKIKLLVSKWESGKYKLKDLAIEENMNFGSMAHLLYRNSDYRKIKLIKRENNFLTKK